MPLRKEIEANTMIFLMALLWVTWNMFPVLCVLVENQKN